MADGYVIIAEFPVTIMNAVWVVMSSILVVSYFVNYVLTPNEGSALVGATRYFTVYGKAKSTQHFADVPKRYFFQFYVVAFLYNVGCFVTILGLCFNKISNNWIADLFSLHESSKPKGDQISLLLLMFLLTVHTARRLYECLFISVYSEKAKICFVQYVWGFVYYLLLPPLLICENLPLQNLPLGSLSVRHVVGTMGFIVAAYIQNESHNIFANLRKYGLVKPHSHGIPMGGFFDYVSCPHYFAEVLMYMFLAVMIWPQCYSWILLLIYNIVVHANMSMQSHRWYKDTFRSYPPERKAYIPYVL